MLTTSPTRELSTSNSITMPSFDPITQRSTDTPLELFICIIGLHRTMDAVQKALGPHSYIGGDWEQFFESAQGVLTSCDFWRGTLPVHLVWDDKYDAPVAHLSLASLRANFHEVRSAALRPYVVTALQYYMKLPAGEIRQEYIAVLQSSVRAIASSIHVSNLLSPVNSDRRFVSLSATLPYLW
jgi:hypothetical protein